MTTVAAVGEVTSLLHAWADGDRDAEDRTLELVYKDLERMAERLMRHERSGHTLDASAVVHEAYMRLARSSDEWESRHQFFAIAGRVMRHVLIDYARYRRREKRGGSQVRMPLHEYWTRAKDSFRCPRLEDALRDLADRHPRLAAIVELRFFGGLTVEETSELLARSARSIARDWRLARAWLVRELGADDRLGAATTDVGL